MKTRLLYSKIDSKILFSQPEGNQDNRIEKKKRKTIRTFFSPAATGAHATASHRYYLLSTTVTTTSI